MLGQAQLSPNEMSALTDLMTTLRSHWPLANFKLFGSKARGTADAESDVDLLAVLPCPITEEIRRRIVHTVFDINLSHESNISVLIVSEEEWRHSLISLLPIHADVEREGIAL
jgi:predicted nucleotidyltransferase